MFTYINLKNQFNGNDFIETKHHTKTKNRDIKNIYTTCFPNRLFFRIKAIRILLIALCCINCQ